MSDQFVAEIRVFGGNFAPRGWALCNGQIMSISQNTALFSLLGTMYGGDGKTNFALPNLMNSAPMHQGQGNGLTERTVGESGGSAAVSLNSTELPLHTHQAGCDAGSASIASPAGNMWAAGGRGRPAAYAPSPADAQMSPLALSVTGGDQPHNNRQPYLGLTFIIALQGIFPSRG